jgi:hypothetical protein
MLQVRVLHQQIRVAFDAVYYKQGKNYTLRRAMI